MRLLKWLVILGLWGGIFSVFFLGWFAAELPDITQAAKFERRPSITVLAADGTQIARYGETKGNMITVSDLPTDLINAVLATEDRRFYEHPGVDVLGIGRALVVNATRGRMVQGGSTITQQLAKNLFLSYDRTLKRKIQEAMLAIWLERHLSKDQILSAYLNRVYLGSGIYGVDAAAKIYFGKEVQNINLRESALIAGLLKAPSRYSPLANPELAMQRSDVVLSAMVDAGYITQKAADAAPRVIPKPPGKKKITNEAGYFADWVLSNLDEIIGTPDMDLIVKTTLSPRIQSKAELSLARQLNEKGTALGASQGAVLVMRPDGAVVAMVGGKDRNDSQFNRATQALRPPGSAFKPVVFLTALEKGWSSNSPILDAPITQGEYRPGNFADKYYGDTTLEQALALSMNTATVRLMKEVGVTAVINNAKKIGITSDLQPDLSLALGSSGISMLEMTTAYSTLANGGFSVTPYAIEAIEEPNGHLLYARKPLKPHPVILDGRAVDTLTLMMQRVITQGTGQQARLPFPASGKTGTSQDYRDAWFIGFTDELVAAVWLGNDDNSPMKKSTGGATPALIWREIMADAKGVYRPVRYRAMGDSKQGGIGGLLNRLTTSSGNVNLKPKNRNPRDFSHLND
ncbi:MAG: PBP1A family penicillin-binding protein [Alphaproteobacteria bacterium]|nr:PBP1A family penicillin-binding protein [Alphaproteobacteria bacterium]MCB9974579.1 PBP1A family penicillin-binding protein [Rhodospirillales bacterium]